MISFQNYKLDTIDSKIKFIGIVLKNQIENDDNKGSDALKPRQQVAYNKENSFLHEPLTLDLVKFHFEENGVRSGQKGRRGKMRG